MQLALGVARGGRCRHSGLCTQPTDTRRSRCSAQERRIVRPGDRRWRGAGSKTAKIKLLLRSYLPARIMSTSDITWCAVDLARESVVSGLRMASNMAHPSTSARHAAAEVGRHAGGAGGRRGLQRPPMQSRCPLRASQPIARRQDQPPSIDSACRRVRQSLPPSCSMYLFCSNSIRRPTIFLRRPHAHMACACGRRLGAVRRPPGRAEKVHRRKRVICGIREEPSPPPRARTKQHARL